MMDMSGKTSVSGKSPLQTAGQRHAGPKPTISNHKREPGSMSEARNGSPIQPAIIVLMLVGGGWYFLNHYQVSGLDRVSVKPLPTDRRGASLAGYRDELSVGSPSDMDPSLERMWSVHDVSDATALRRTIDEERTDQRADTPRQIANSRLQSIRIATWSLDGFGPTKLSSPDSRRTICRVIRQFDIVAVQQVAAIERDLVTRLVDAVNEGDPRYDFVLGKSTGPVDRPEHLAFIFDTTRVEVDRTQTYSLSDPADTVKYDPLVAWFRTAEPSHDAAWTFSLVNVRIDLASAAAEVAVIPSVLTAVRRDGRGEDDVVLLGLFQADDAYLRKVLLGSTHESIVRSGTTDIFGRYQTSNVLVAASSSTEYVGRCGAFDFLRVFNLSLAEAEAASSHLPVFAEFSPLEGGVR